MTGAGRLPCGKVIHAVGPVWRGGGNGERQALASCYRRCLELADQAGLDSVAFPNISTGIYGYPKAEAAEVALETVAGMLPRLKMVSRVVFACFDRENLQLYRRGYEKLKEAQP